MSRLMFWVCVRLGLVLSASLAAMSLRSWVAVRLFAGLGLLYSSCIHWCRVVSTSFSSLRMISWASGPLRRFQRVVLLMPSSSAICWLVHEGWVITMSMAWVVSACVLASAGVIPVSTSSCGVPRLLRVNGFERVGVFLFMFLMVCAYYSVDEPRSVAAGPEGVNRPALL